MDASRRRFLVGGLATVGLLGGVIALEKILGGSSAPREDESAFVNARASGLAKKILEHVTPQDAPLNYRRDYEAFSEVISDARYCAEKFSDHKAKELFKKFEVLGLMYQARTLKNAGTNILLNEDVEISDKMPPVRSPASLRLGNTFYNALKERENYQRILNIYKPYFQLTGNVGYGLGGYGEVGEIASLMLVNRRKNETIHRLANSWYEAPSELRRVGWGVLFDPLSK